MGRPSLAVAGVQHDAGDLGQGAGPSERFGQRHRAQARPQQGGFRIEPQGLGAGAAACGVGQRAKIKPEGQAPPGPAPEPRVNGGQAALPRHLQPHRRQRQRAVAFGMPLAQAPQGVADGYGPALDSLGGAP